MQGLKIAVSGAGLYLLLLTGAAQAETAVYTCKQDSDCRLVTSYVPPVDGRPGKTLVKCNHSDNPLQEGETLTGYNDYLTGQCGCIEATQTCGLKD